MLIVILSGFLPDVVLAYVLRGGATVSSKRPIRTTSSLFTHFHHTDLKDLGGAFRVHVNLRRDHAGHQRFEGELRFSATPILQQHPTVDNLARFLPWASMTRSSCALAWLSATVPRLLVWLMFCCWVDFFYIAPGSHDQMTCLLLNAGQKTWEGRVDPPRVVTPQGALDPLVQVGRDVWEGLSLREHVRAD